MTNINFENARCSRCTRMCYTCVLKDMRYCSACFDIMNNSPETKEAIHKIMIQCGLEDLETWHD